MVCFVEDKRLYQDESFICLKKLVLWDCFVFYFSYFDVNHCIFASDGYLTELN